MSVSKNLKWTICLGGLLAPWLLAGASLPAVAQLNLEQVVAMPVLPITGSPQATLRAFDISWVDPDSHTYALAASALFCGSLINNPNPPPSMLCSAVGSASLPGVLTVNTQTKAPKLLAVGKFAGTCPTTAPFSFAAGQSGPNGLVIIGKEIWVGDGPFHGNPNTCTGTITTNSTVKVLDPTTGDIKHTILTGEDGMRGRARADELCYNPFTNSVLVANNTPIDNFITFISTETYDVLGTIKFDGSDQKGNNILANGIEQCVFNPRDKKFYLNIPATVVGTPPGPGPGLVLTISEHAPFHVERVFTIDPATKCTGPNGLAVGPSNQMALGCGGTSTNSLVINSTNGNPAVTVTNEGGTDEAWYNPTANQYYFARSTAGKLGVENAGPPATPATDTPTGVGSHSVAADPNLNSPKNKSQVYVPIRGNLGQATTTATCSSKTPGTDANGCIAVFDAP
jgi:hypothetical protein